MIIFLIAFIISWQHPGADSFTVYRNGEPIAQTQRLYFEDTTAESCIRHKYWITAWKYGRETVPSKVVSGLWLDCSCGCPDTMVWKDHQGDDLLKIVLPRSKWIYSWRLRDEVFQVHTKGWQRTMACSKDTKAMGGSLWREYRILQQRTNDYTQKSLQTMLKVNSSGGQRNPADITEQVKCLCLYDLNHDGVVDLSDFVMLEPDLEMLREFRNVYGRRAEYEFWR